MGDKHVVRFEPVGIEIEVDEDQTILRAAAEQGITLMHGCKEGQCASCKSFVLDGEDIELDKYSTFALPDFEREEGFTLLCRAHVYEDVTIELLNYDEEMIRSGLPIQDAVAEVVSNEPVTHDLRHLVIRLLEPREIKFFPGQYVDIAVPGTDEHRSFSMANTNSSKETASSSSSSRSTRTACSRTFSTPSSKVGDKLDVQWPFGVFTLREGHDDNDLSSSAAVRGWRRSCRCCARWTSAAAAARRSTTTALAAGATCVSRRSCRSCRTSLPISATSRRCRSRPTPTTGTVRPG